MDVAVDGKDARMRGVRASQLPLDRALSMEYEGAEPILFRNVWPTTPSGKIELQSALLGSPLRCSAPHLPAGALRPIH